MARGCRRAAHALGQALGADIPSRGTDLGSSSSLTVGVGLINALSADQGQPISPDDLGRLGGKVEIDLCGQPIGKQDQERPRPSGSRSHCSVKISGRAPCRTDRTQERDQGDIQRHF